MRAAVDGDDEFRERLKPAANQDLIGRAGVLWITRPDGWGEELEALVTAHESATAERETGSQERSAGRRVEAAERAARRAAADLAVLRATNDELQAELVEERRARREADIDAARTRHRVSVVEAELSRMRNEYAAMTELPDRLAVLERERAELLARIEVLTGDLDAARHELLERGESSIAEVFVEPSAPGIDHAGLAKALADAAAALARAAEAAVLSTSAQAIGDDDDRPHDAPSTHLVRARLDETRRRRLPAPPGRFGDSREAAESWLRAPDVVLIVDGYNVTKSRWPEYPLADQRARLVDALDELAARFAIDVVVVFDGAGAPGATAITPHRSRVRVEFSPEGIIADDVIVDRVSAVPVQRPVVVASSDGELRDRLRPAGANVIGSAQLLTVLRR